MGYSFDYNELRICGGVYDRRMYQNYRHNTTLTPTEEQKQTAEELKEKMAGVTVTISQEGFDRESYMADLRERKEEMRAQKERDREEHSYLNHLNKGDVFEQCFGQWYLGSLDSIISGTLDEMGFYDDLSDDETLEVECLLAGITYGMNTVGGGIRVADPVCGELTSQAARFELESSTAALKQFSKKYVPSKMQEQFAELIDQYYKHNEKALQGYRSSAEISDELTAKYNDEIASTRLFPIMEETEVIKGQLGKVKNTKDDVGHAVKEWQKQLRMLVSGVRSVNDSMQMMRNTLNALASGNSKDQGVLQYVDRRGSYSIENARQYWGMLL